MSIDWDCKYTYLGDEEKIPITLCKTIWNDQYLELLVRSVPCDPEYKRSESEEMITLLFYSDKKQGIGLRTFSGRIPEEPWLQTRGRGTVPMENPPNLASFIDNNSDVFLSHPKLRGAFNVYLRQYVEPRVKYNCMHSYGTGPDCSNTPDRLIFYLTTREQGLTTHVDLACDKFQRYHWHHGDIMLFCSKLLDAASYHEALNEIHGLGDELLQRARNQINFTIRPEFADQKADIMEAIQTNYNGLLERIEGVFE